MNSTALDLKSLLVTAALGTYGATSGWGIYVSVMPAAPDTVIALFDAGGLDADPKFRLDAETVNVQVRGSEAGYAAAYEKAVAVRDALLGLPSQTIGGTHYVGIWQRGGIGMAGRDDRRRPIISMNFLVRRVPATGTYRQAI